MKATSWKAWCALTLALVSDALPLELDRHGSSRKVALSEELGSSARTAAECGVHHDDHDRSSGGNTRARFRQAERQPSLSNRNRTIPLLLTGMKTADGLLEIGAPISPRAAPDELSFLQSQSAVQAHDFVLPARLIRFKINNDWWYKNRALKLTVDQNHNKHKSEGVRINFFMGKHGERGEVPQVHKQDGFWPHISTHTTLEMLEQEIVTKILIPDMTRAQCQHPTVAGHPDQVIPISTIQELKTQRCEYYHLNYCPLIADGQNEPQPCDEPTKVKIPAWIDSRNIQDVFETLLYGIDDLRRQMTSDYLNLDASQGKIGSGPKTHTLHYIQLHCIHI